MATTVSNVPQTLIKVTKWTNPLYWGLLLLLFMFLWQQGPLIQMDTGSYLGSNPQRSALYPLILQLNHFFFGAHYHGLVLLQLLFGFLAIHFLSFKFLRLFHLPFWAIFPISFILLTPYFGPTKFGNAILTEAICYPVFLIAFAYLLEGILLKKNRPLFYFLGLTAILIFTRRQFLFLYPAFAAVLLSLFLFNKKSFRLPLLTVTFIFSMIATNVLERTYTWVYHGHFKTIPFTGLQLIIAPLYIAEDTDIAYLTEPEERALFQAVRHAMSEKNLTRQSYKTDSHSPYVNFSIYTHFFESYNPICWGTLSPILGVLKLNDVFKADILMTKMALTLMQHNFSHYFKLYCVNIAYNMGGWYFNFFLAFLGIITALHYVSKRDSISMACLLSLLLTGANYTLVALVEPVLRRYSIYTDTILICMLIIIVILALKKQPIFSPETE